jgi:hypothetical protein
MTLSVSKRHVACVAAALSSCLLSVPGEADLVAVSDELPFNTYTADDQISPSIARLADGGFIVVWQSFGQSGDNDFDVFGQRFDPGGTLVGTEFQVNTYTTDDQTAARVVASDNGGFVVVWQSRGHSGGIDYDVVVRRFNSTGAGVGSDVVVNAFTTDDQARPALAKAANGSFVVAWQSFDQVGGFDYDVFGRRLTSNGVPTGAEFGVNAATADDQSAPTVAAASDGTFIVAWQAYDAQSGDAEILARRFSAAGAPLAAATQVNFETRGDQSVPQIAAAPGGSFVVVWQTYDANGLDAAISARRVDGNAVPLGTEISVNETSDGDQTGPVVAVDDASARFVVAWTSDGQDQPASYGVFARAFDSGGLALGNEITINQTVADDQESPTLAALGGGQLSVAWQSFGQEAPLDAGIVGRLFSLGSGTCGDYTANGTITAADALGALRAAVGLLSCQVCICDVDRVNSVKATDALLILNFAVGLPVTLDCISC